MATTVNTLTSSDLQTLREQDNRYCGVPRLSRSGAIARSTVEVAKFKKIHPCPSTGTTGACPGWDIDHVIPLACGGCDAVNNMQWLPHTYKITGKDRWERKIYSQGLPGTPACISEQVLQPTK